MKKPNNEMEYIPLKKDISFTKKIIKFLCSIGIHTRMTKFRENFWLKKACRDCYQEWLIRPY